MARRKEPRISDHLLDQLLAGADAKSAFAKDGLLDELKKALAERALNAKLRRAVQARGHFPIDESAIKLLFLVLRQTQKEWKMPPREWGLAKAQFAILFEGRFRLG